MSVKPQRKIVHVDMDAFYASVEQRDDPKLRGRPVVVAWKGRRSVVCAASYEARQFGIHSAMPALRAEQLCKEAIFVPPDFNRYRTASKIVRAIFAEHTDLIEPLSLDEAYLDVSENKLGLATATEVASKIRADIFEQLALTASAGIAPNKFLAKIASDWRKPNGQFVVKPHQVAAFLTDLPVKKIPGVGKVTNQKLAKLGIETVGQLREWSLVDLERHFGNYAAHLHKRALGQDDSEVVPNRPVQSISAEDTFSDDRPLAEVAPEIPALADKVWASRQKTKRIPRTVVLKLKRSDFKIITRSHTPELGIHKADDLKRIALELLEKLRQQDQSRYRLVGVGLGNFRDLEEQMQRDLFT